MGDILKINIGEKTMSFSKKYKNIWSWKFKEKFHIPFGNKPLVINSLDLSIHELHACPKREMRGRYITLN